MNKEYLIGIMGVAALLGATYVVSRPATTRLPRVTSAAPRSTAFTSGPGLVPLYGDRPYTSVMGD